jgi:hypothetical protein
LRDLRRFIDRPLPGVDHRPQIASAQPEIPTQEEDPNPNENNQNETKKSQALDRRGRRKPTKKKHFHTASFSALSERR